MTSGRICRKLSNTAFILDERSCFVHYGTGILAYLYVIVFIRYIEPRVERWAHMDVCETCLEKAALAQFDGWKFGRGGNQ